MKLINPTLLLGAFGVVALSSAPVSAQDGQIPAEAAPRAVNRPNRSVPDYEVQMYQVRNVRPSVIAWWLDPIHNEMPIEFRSSADLEAIINGKPEAVDKAAELASFLERFPGVQSISALDPTNQIIVVGTPKSFAKVSEQLALLDKPIRQVEVEAKFIETNPENLRELGLQVLSFKTENEAQQNFDLGDGKAGPLVEEKLNALIAAGKAKVLTAPRVTVINGMYGSIGTGSAVPATIGIKDENGQFRELNGKVAGVDASNLFLGLQWSFVAKVTLNKDNTVGLYIEPLRRLNVSDLKQQIPLQLVERRRAVLTLRDGDAVALTGATFATTVQEVINGTGKSGVMIVTPRIVRRAGDE